MLSGTTQAASSNDFLVFIIGLIALIAIAFIFFYIFLYRILYKIIYKEIIKRLIDIKERKVNAEIESLRAKSKAE